MRRSLGAFFAVAVLGAMMFPTAAGANNNKVDVCHSEGNGSYHLINISENAVQQHIDNHGDGLPGDPVPGMDGFVFDDDCVPVLNYLVRAISKDDAGNTRVISELLDTNGDGVPSTGDTVKLYEYPTDFAGTSYSPFATTGCILDGFVTVDDLAAFLRVRGVSSDPDCRPVIWIDVYGRFEQFVAHDTSPFRFVSLIDGEGLGFDRIEEFPPGVLLSRSDSTDHRWLDIEFNLTP